jgi:hypothetical protein
VHGNGFLPDSIQQFTVELLPQTILQKFAGLILRPLRCTSSALQTHFSTASSYLHRYMYLWYCVHVDEVRILLFAITGENYILCNTPVQAKQSTAGPPTVCYGGELCNLVVFCLCIMQGNALLPRQYPAHRLIGLDRRIRENIWRTLGEFGH